MKTYSRYLTRRLLPDVLLYIRAIPKALLFVAAFALLTLVIVPYELVRELLFPAARNPLLSGEDNDMLDSIHRMSV